MEKVYGYSRSNRGLDELIFQNQALYDYTKSMNYKLELYTDTNSGTIIGVQLQRILNVIPNGSKVITLDRSRFSRNSKDLELIMNEFRSRNIEVVFLCELK